MTGGTQAALKIEILLQINERLYSGGLIGRDLYERAKIKIVEMEEGPVKKFDKKR